MNTVNWKNDKYLPLAGNRIRRNQGSYRDQRVSYADWGTKEKGLNEGGYVRLLFSPSRMFNFILL